MPNTEHPVLLATRGSALALVQTNLVLAQCRAAFPDLQFEIKIIKTTGDKLQTAPPDIPGMPGTKGLFTKELEVALLKGEADLAVHSLKDLPTELPDGLALRAVLPRADVRDVFIYRDAEFLGGSGKVGASAGPAQRGLRPGATVRDLPQGATVATSSTRRQAQLLALRPDLKLVPIRGNVGTRLQKLANQAELDGLVLAAAGLQRLQFEIAADGKLGRRPGREEKDAVPPGLRAAWLPVGEMIPCVGQGAIGIEGREDDPRMARVYDHLMHTPTWHCVTAERAFLHAMGGGCLSPVAAYAVLEGEQIRLRAVSFRQEQVRRDERVGPANQAAALGIAAAAELKR